jgi:hypothetical protein
MLQSIRSDQLHILYLLFQVKQMEKVSDKIFKPQLGQHFQPDDFLSRTILLENKEINVL